MYRRVNVRSFWAWATLVGVLGLGCSSKAPSQPGENPEPPPHACAGELSAATATDFYAAVQCLFEGTDPPQKNVAPGTIDRERVSVLRGRALDRDGAPLADARVTAAGHSEFGETRTRTDGTFDLAVNGGGSIAVRVVKDDLLPVQRHVTAEWRMFAVLPDVVLLSMAEPTLVDIAAANGEAVVVQSAPSQDASGTRRTTVVVPSATKATLVMPDGSRNPLSAFHLRMTEYTVGERGPNAMPGDLPSTSAYTFASDFSVDEARSAGARQVEFDPPVISYVDNFLSFPAGTVVPLGWYDEDRDVWQAENSGVVVKVLSVGGDGLAQIDADGDGQAEPNDALVKLGIGAEEQRAIGSTFTPGQSAWRVPIAHFSSWDCNWPFGPPADAEEPDSSTDSAKSDDCRSNADGSIIGCEDQTLGEVLPVGGTPFSLHYQSERTPGRSNATQLLIRLSGARVPKSLKRIDLEVEVLGRVTKQSFPAGPNISYTFAWDRQDAYGRVWQGRQTAKVRVGWAYDASYQSTGRFGFSGNGVPITGDRARQEITLWKNWRGYIGGIDARGTGLGGWTLSAHHLYDPNGRVLYLGDGHTRTAEGIGAVITTVAGTGSFGSTGDGGPATSAKIAAPHGLVVAPDGTAFFSEDGGARIRKIAPDGTISTYAGTGVAGFSGDEGPAVQAQLSRPLGLALGRDGTLYVADGNNRRVRAISPDGNIRSVAGGGAPGLLTNGDGGPATSAQFDEPHALALGPDGALYIADSNAGSVRRIGTDGIISTVAGGGSGIGVEGALATSVSLNQPLGLAIGPSQEIYVTEWSGNRVRRIDPSGAITTVIGLGTSDSNDGSLAKTASIFSPHTVDVGPDGTLYITEEGTNRVRKITPDGLVQTVAGGGSGSELGDLGSPLNARFSLPRVVFVHKDGSLWICDFYGQRIRRVQQSLPGYVKGEIALASDDGGLVFVFSARGQHLRTLDARTRVVLLSFEYDGAGQLSRIVDRVGDATTIERNAAGDATAIVGPFGQRTALEIGQDGWVSSVTNALAESTRMTYGTGGLLATMTDPVGGPNHAFEYDALGRLTKDIDPSGSFQTLAVTKSEQGTVVRHSTRLHRTTTFSSSATGVRTYTSASGVTAMSTADGTITTPTSTIKVKRGADPRFGMQAPYAAEVETRTGSHTSKATITRTATLSDPTDLLSLVSAEETTTANGRTSRVVWDAQARTITSTSPERRVSVMRLDEVGRVVSVTPPGLAVTTIAYDAHDRPTAMVQGGRTTSFAYGSDGRVSQITNPIATSLGLSYDAAGRLSRTSFVDGSALSLAFDANGNTTRVTPPGGQAHTFAFTPGDRLASYTAPAANTSTFAYDDDGLAASTTLADGRVVSISRDSAGRPSAMNAAGTAFAWTYDATTGQLTQVSRAGEQVAFRYNGALLSEEAWSGEVSGRVTRTYGAGDMWLSSEAVNGARIDYRYDDDGLVTYAGGMTLQRDFATGLITGTQLASASDTWTHDAFGQPLTYRSHVSTAQFDFDLVRDALGRVTSRTETVLGATHAFTYQYDLRGRLTDVTRDGAPAGHYTYDANGNRLTSDGAFAAYDSEDRLVSAGDATYEHNTAGERTKLTRAGQTTSYAYDALGQLIGVTLPDGRAIEYVLDGHSRRVGKKVGGALTRGFLYRDSLRPVAERDASGAIVSRFIYASKPQVPDAMVRGGTTYRILSDSVGSVRVVVDAQTGAVAQELEYDAWGRVLRDTNPGFQPFGFAGGMYDADTGLVHFGAREYDAATGRWTSKDASGFAGGANFYVYADGDPVNRIDPNGHWAILIPIAIGAIEGAGIAAGIDIGIQLAMKGCVDWWQVGEQALIGGAIGAVTGGAIGAVRGGIVEAAGGTQGAFGRILGFTERNLQKGFTKHGADFGMTGNWNPSRAADFSRAVNQHINAPGVRSITGTYRGSPVTHYVDPRTGLNVIADQAGNYVSGWRLGAEQLEGVLTTGRLF